MSYRCCVIATTTVWLMWWNDQIELGNRVDTIVYGEPVQIITWTTVYANKKSVRQSEYYQAKQLDLKPEIMFEVYFMEYDGEEYVRYNDKVYTIIRTYEKDTYIELVVGALNNG